MTSSLKPLELDRKKSARGSNRKKLPVNDRERMILQMDQ